MFGSEVPHVPEKLSKTDILIHELPPEVSVEGQEIDAQIDWERAENEFGTVEYKLYKGAKGSNKVLLYVPGVGGALRHFEQRFVQTLLEQGYDVATVCRNGTVINDENRESINSQERISMGQTQGQDHIGALPAYGYDEWTQEMAAAMVSLNSRYGEFVAIGSSTGALIGLESIRLLQQQEPAVLSKLSRFVALSGMVGSISTDEDGARWLDQNTGFGSDKLTQFFDAARDRDGGCRMKDPETMIKESYGIVDRLYRDTHLPTSLVYSTVSAEGDKYFSLQHSFDLAEKVRSEGGIVQVWHNRAEEKNPHGQRELSPAALVAILNDPKDDQRFKVIRRDGPLGPDNKGTDGL